MSEPVQELQVRWVFREAGSLLEQGITMTVSQAEAASRDLASLAADARARYAARAAKSGGAS